MASPSRRLSWLKLWRGFVGDLASPDMIFLAWLPVLVIGLLHYASSHQQQWAHDVLRRLYYVPILFAAFSRGVRGGVAVAVVVSLSYSPHAFFLTHYSQDPGTTLNKLLEIILYNVIGLLGGVLADRESARRRQAERAVAEQQRMAEQLIRAGRLTALGELVAGIAHEIKNPIHTLKGTAEIVDEIIPSDAEQAPMWALLRRELERLERVADRFLSFARPSEPDARTCAFANVYGRIGELVAAQARAHQGVRHDVQPLEEAVGGSLLRADSDQLAQVALNIAGNAILAMEGRGQLTISGRLRTDDSNSWVVLRVDNDGPVIADQYLERIFDPFFTRTDGGTGLGLAIAARIVEAHGGFIEVVNTGQQRGVAFTVTLPVAVGDE